MLAVVQQACVEGVSTRRVADLARSRKLSTTVSNSAHPLRQAGRPRPHAEVRPAFGIQRMARGRLRVSMSGRPGRSGGYRSPSLRPSRHWSWSAASLSFPTSKTGSPIRRRSHGASTRAWGTCSRAWRRAIATRCSTRRRASSPCARGWRRAASLHRSASRRRSGRGSTGSVRVWTRCWRCRALTRSGASRSCGWRRTASASESGTTLSPGSGKRRNGVKARKRGGGRGATPTARAPRAGEPARVNGGFLASNPRRAR